MKNNNMKQKWNLAKDQLFSKQSIMPALVELKNRLLFLFYNILAIVFISITQSAKQFDSIVQLVIDKDWSFILCFMIGILCIAEAIKKLIKIMIWMVKAIASIVRIKKK